MRRGAPGWWWSFAASNTERAVRRLVARLGGPEGLACCYQAGPTGYELYRVLSGMGGPRRIVAPSLTPVRPATA